MTVRSKRRILNVPRGRIEDKHTNTKTPTQLTIWLLLLIEFCARLASVRKGPCIEIFSRYLTISQPSLESLSIVRSIDSLPSGRHGVEFFRIQLNQD